MTPEQKAQAQDVLDGLLRDSYQQGYNQALKDREDLREKHRRELDAISLAAQGNGWLVPRAADKTEQFKQVEELRQKYERLAKGQEERQSGRTTRMLWAAMTAFKAGRNVFVVVSGRDHEKTKIRAQLDSMLNSGFLPWRRVEWNHCGSGFFPRVGYIRLITCDQAGFDLNRLVLRGVPAEDVFIDHLVIDVDYKEHCEWLLRSVRRW